MKTIKIKLNKDMRGYKKGQVLTLSNNNIGVKIDKSWLTLLNMPNHDDYFDVIKKRDKNNKKEKITVLDKQDV